MILRFRVYGVIDIDAEEGISDVLDKLREQGSGDVIDVEIAKGDTPLADSDFAARYSRMKAPKSKKE